MCKYSFNKKILSFKKLSKKEQYFIQEIAQKFANKVQKETLSGIRAEGNLLGFHEFINETINTEHILNWWSNLNVVQQMNLTQIYLTRDDCVNNTLGEIKHIFNSEFPNESILTWEDKIIN